MNQDNFYKKLRIICLILAIICMGLSLIKKAKAAEVPYDNWADFVYYDTYNRMNTSTKTSMDNLNYHGLIDYLTQYFPYFMRYSNSNNNSVYYTFSIAEEFAFQTMWGSFQDNVVHVKTNYSNTSIQTNGFNYSYAEGTNVSPILVSFNGYNWNCIFPTIYISSDGYIQINNLDFYYSTSVYTMNYYENGVQDGTVRRLTTSLNGYGRFLYAFYANISDSSERTFDKFDSNCKCYVTQDYNRGVYNHLDNTLQLLQSNTENFEVYKYGSSGSERLVCDFSNCISISNAVGNSSTIQVDINIDGVDKSFNFDSTSSYYDYSVSSSRAIYSFPLTVFGINNETISAKLTRVTVNNTTSSPGGLLTKKIVCVTPLILVGSSYEDVIPEVIPDAPDYTLNVNNQQYYEEIENKITSEWVEDVTQSDVHNYVDGNTLICAYQRGLTWADWWNDWSGFFANVQDIPTYIFDNSPSSTDEFKTKMMDFLKNNYGSLYFDTVIITWDPRNGELPLIYVWKTNLYQLKNTNSILKDMAEDLNISAFYTKQAYFDIKGRLDDFEEKSLTKLNEMVGLQEKENGFISSLQSILNQILNALLNLDLEIPEADYSSITSRLDQIISNQGTGNLNNDWYDDYRSWLYGKDLTDDLISPHEFFIEIFVPIKNTYEAFVNNNSISGYIADMDLYVKYLSGRINDNLSIYFKDGIGSAQFDIDDNTMLTVGGNP